MDQSLHLLVLLMLWFSTTTDAGRVPPTTVTPREKASASGARWLQQQPLLIYSGSDLVIDGDVVWSREETPAVEINGELQVAEGASLTIKEGVSVFFSSPTSKILNNGLLIIEGGENEEDRVFLQPRDSAASWGGVEFGPTAVPTEYRRKTNTNARNTRQKTRFKYIGGSRLLNADLVNACNNAEAGALAFPNMTVTLVEKVKILGCDGVGLRVEETSQRSPTAIVIRDTVIEQVSPSHVGILVNGRKENFPARLIAVLQNVRVQRPSLPTFTALQSYAFSSVWMHSVRMSSCHFDGGIHMEIRQTTIVDSVVHVPNIPNKPLQPTMSVNLFRTPQGWRNDYRNDFPSVFSNNTFVGGEGVFFKDLVDSVAFRQNDIRDIQGGGISISGCMRPFDAVGNTFTNMSSSSASVSIDTSQVQFSENRVSNCTSVQDLFLLRQNKSQMQSFGGRKLFSVVRDNIMSDVKAHTLFKIGDAEFEISSNIVKRRSVLSQSVDVRRVPIENSSGNITFPMQGNFWGPLQDDIVGGKRRTVLDALTAGSGPVVDFVTVKERPNRKSRLVAVPLASGITRENGESGVVTLGGVLWSGSAHLENLGTVDATSSIVVTGTATLSIGPNVHVRFAEGASLLVLNDATLVVDGGSDGSSLVVTSSTLTLHSSRRVLLRRVDIIGKIDHVSDSDLILDGVTLQGRLISTADQEIRFTTPKPPCIRSVPFVNRWHGITKTLMVKNTTMMNCVGTGIEAWAIKSLFVVNSTLLGSSDFGLKIADVYKEFVIENCTIDQEPATSTTGQALEFSHGSEPKCRQLAIRNNFIRYPGGLDLIGCFKKVFVEGNVFVGKTRDWQGRRAIGTTPCARCPAIFSVQNNTITNFTLPLNTTRIGYCDEWGGEVLIHNGRYDSETDIVGNVFFNVTSLGNMLALGSWCYFPETGSLWVPPPSFSGTSSMGVRVSGNTFHSNCHVVRREQPFLLSSTQAQDPAFLAISDWPLSCTTAPNLTCHARSNTFLKDANETQVKNHDPNFIFVANLTTQGIEPFIDASYSDFGTTRKNLIERRIRQRVLNTLRFLPFNKTNGSGKTVPRCGLVKTCSFHGVCQGKRRDGDNALTCQCDEGWEGEECDLFT